MVEATDRTIWDLVALTLASLGQGQLPSKAIFMVLLSKGLGLGIVAGSTMVKIPQVVAVLRARSADGLNPLSFELETLALAIAAAYGVLNGLAFSAFGESVGILLQNVVLLALIYRFQGRSTARVAVVVSVLAAWAAAVTQGALQPAHLAPLYDVATTIGMASRLPQIAQNLASRSTGQLSLITYGLNTAGAAARIFTTLQEKNAGAAMLRGAVMSTLLNGILALQIVMYGKRGKGAKKGRSSARGKKKAT